MEFKVNIGDPKSGKTLKKVFSEEESKNFVGKKIGSVIKGDSLGFSGYEFEVTGGSDYCGFPMRRDVQGIARKKVLTVKGFGNRIAERKGLRYRRNVAGNTIFSKTAQINLKVVKAGTKPLFEEKKEEAPAEAKESGEAAKEQNKEAGKTPKETSKDSKAAAKNPEEDKKDAKQDDKKEDKKE